MPWCSNCHKYHETLTTGCPAPLFVPASGTQATFTPADAESARSSELAACRSRVAELERQLAGFEHVYETQTAAIVEWKRENRRLRELLRNLLQERFTESVEDIGDEDLTAAEWQARAALEVDHE